MNIKKQIASKNGIIWLILISIIIVFLILSLAILITNKKKMLIDGGLIKLNSEKEQELFSYAVIDNSDENNIKVFATVYSYNGIEYIIIDDTNKIYGNQKNKISFDYNVKKEQTYTIKIKEVGKDEISKQLIINDNNIENTSIKLEKIAESNGCKVISINKMFDMEEFKTYYKIGKKGTWKEKQGEGDIYIFDYDLINQGLVNTDNTVTITAKVQDLNGNITCISKDYAVDVTVTEGLIYSREQLEAMTETGKYKLMSNIDLNEKDWVTIENFSGIFNGNGYTILNLKGKAFLNMTSNSTLKNTRFENLQAPVVWGTSGSYNVRIEKVGIVSGDFSNISQLNRCPFTGITLGGAVVNYVFKDCYTREIDNSQFNFAGCFVDGNYDKCYSSGNSPTAMNHDGNGYYGIYNNCFCSSKYGSQPYAGLNGIADFSNADIYINSGWDFKSGDGDTEYTWEIIDGYPELKIFADRDRGNSVDDIEMP